MRLIINEELFRQYDAFDHQHAAFGRLPMRAAVVREAVMADNSLSKYVSTRLRHLVRNSRLLRVLILAGSLWLTVRLLAMLARHSPVGNAWSSRYIRLLMSRCKQPPQAATLRTAFARTPFVRTGKTPGHTHPDAASKRNATVNTMELFAATVRKTPYFVQESTNDVKHMRRGCRTWYWDKDLAVDFSPFDVKGDEIICMVDVDHYMDMPTMLAHYVQPYLISTFQPTDVAKCDGEYSFTFNKQGDVKYRVSGGAEYSHPVWNYAPDTILVAAPTFCNLGYNVASYNVERIQVDPHHQLILLAPLRRFWSPMFELTTFLHGNRLCRLNPVDSNGFTRMTVQTMDGLRVVTGKVDSYASAVTTAAIDGTLCNVSGISKTDITLASVKVAAGITDQGQASVLTAYHRVTSGGKAAQVTMADAVRGYQFSPTDYDPDAKPCIVSYANPIVDSAIAPDQTRSNEEQAIRGRVQDVLTKTELTPYVLNAITAFSALLVPGTIRGKLTPLDIDEVYERQNRPTQRNILDQGALSAATVSDDAMKCFMKKEPYGKVTDPRIISTLPATTKLHYSRYTYAFAEHLRTMEWYAFGKTPLEIAERVATICEPASKVTNTDLSRFDGHVSEVFRTLEKCVMMEAFDERYHEELSELQTKQYNQRAKTRFGITYFTWLIRASGSSETADFNSFDNAFIAFMGFMYMGYTPAEAWAKLGVYGGDDGLTADINDDAYIKAATTCGQVLEVEAIQRFEPGVSFLSRQFSPYVWTGAMDSCCDIKRTLQKLPTTVMLPPAVTPLMKMGEKLRSLALTDGQTPIIRDLIHAYNSHSAVADAKACGASDSWWARYDLTEQFPNNNVCSWQDDYVAKSLPTFDWNMFKRAMVAAKRDVQVLLRMPCCVPRLEDTKPHKHAVVIDGDILAAPGSMPPPPLNTDAPTTFWTPPEIAKPRVRPTRPPITRQMTQIQGLSVPVKPTTDAEMQQIVSALGKASVDDMPVSGPTTPTYQATTPTSSPSSPSGDPMVLDAAMQCGKCHMYKPGTVNAGNMICLCDLLITPALLTQSAKPVAATKPVVTYCIDAKTKGLNAEGKCAYEARTGRVCKKSHATA